MQEEKIKPEDLDETAREAMNPEKEEQGAEFDLTQQEDEEEKSVEDKETL
ncbi:hypothetical protein KKA15_04625 [Patescibacteria group bacterium]|nr:hypothetical protein [Patescibacteria group bacterium]